MLKQDTFFIMICKCCFVVLASKKRAKIKLLKHLFRKHRFCEKGQTTLKKKWLFMILQVADLQKSIRNRCQNAFEKNIRKKPPGNRFVPPLGPPKTSPNRPGTQKNEVSNEACFATLWKSPASRREASGAGVCKASKWLGI